MKWNVEKIKSKQVKFVNAQADALSSDIPSNIKGIFLEGAPHKGKATHIFAYYGVPEGALNAPAVILVHGGCGFAEHYWVDMWVKRGYAAIAIDNDSHMYPSSNTFKTENSNGGAHGFGSFNQLNDNDEDTWIYQSVTNILLGINFLECLPQVDKQKIGIAGISWGGYLSLIALSQDNRLKWGSISYTGGYLYEDTFFTSELNRQKMDKNFDRWKNECDSVVFAPLITQPLLFVRAPDDTAFDYMLFNRFIQKVTAPYRLAFLKNMVHDQMQGSCQAEVFDFADSINGKGFSVALQPTLLKGGELSSRISGSASNPKLYYSDTLTSKCHGLTFKSVNAVIDKDIIRSEIPLGAVTAYFNVTSANGIQVSSLPIVIN